MKKRNPWLVEDEQEEFPGSMTCTVDDRVQMIKESEDIDWLRRVLTWPETQLTVQVAAMRRVNALIKAKTIAAKAARRAV
jgi:hypothetical protein